MGPLRCLRIGCRLLPILACVPCFSADVCAPADIHGAYGFQLAGTTTISGKETPIATVGRLVFDGAGSISGTSSVNFNGLFLGNPTTGSYEAKDDCSITFSLQDTSGAFQHFNGSSASGGDRAEIRQSDPRTHVRGSMVRLPDSCTSSSFQGEYHFTITGRATPLASEGSKGSGDAKALAQADGYGNLLVTRGDAKTSGTYTVDSDCFVQLSFGLADGDSNTSIQLRGVLADGGKELLAVETDPEQVGSARFSR